MAVIGSCRLACVLCQRGAPGRLCRGRTSASGFHHPVRAAALAIQLLRHGHPGGPECPDRVVVSTWINDTKFAEAPALLVEDASVYRLNVPSDIIGDLEVEGGREGILSAFRSWASTPTRSRYGTAALTPNLT